MRIVLLTAVCLAAVLCSCHKADSGLFTRLYGSDFGLGFSLSQTPEQVHAKLGKPSGETTRSAGLSVTEYFLPEGESELASSTPQLSLTFIEDSLIGVYNRYYPEDAKKPLPLYFAEIIPGVKLGNRRSDFITALGEPPGGAGSNEWLVKAEDGRSITISARFTEVPAVNDALCSSINIAYIPAVGQLKGEEHEKQEELKRKIHEQATGKRTETEGK
jgi:hypothetical protein